MLMGVIHHSLYRVMANLNTKYEVPGTMRSQKLKKERLSLTAPDLRVFCHPSVKTCHDQFVYQIWNDFVLHPFQSWDGSKILTNIIMTPSKVIQK